jgi:hypothetical protein
VPATLAVGLKEDGLLFLAALPYLRVLTFRLTIPITDLKNIAARLPQQPFRALSHLSINAWSAKIPPHSHARYLLFDLAILLSISLHRGNSSNFSNASPQHVEISNKSESVPRGYLCSISAAIGYSWRHSSPFSLLMSYASSTSKVAVLCYVK